MAQAASEAGISPLSISFTASVRVIRRAIPKFQQLTLEKLVQGRKWLFDELLDELLPERGKAILSASSEKAVLKVSN